MPCHERQRPTSPPRRAVPVPAPRRTTAVAIRLPKLQLPKFAGDKLKWQEWWEPYCLHFHENEELSSVDKFTFLRTFLEGEAARSISNLPTTEAAYEEAIQMLQDRYGPPKEIGDAVYRKLQSMRAVGSNDVKS